MSSDIADSLRLSKALAADTIDQMQRIAGGMTGKRLRYQDLIEG